MSISIFDRKCWESPAVIRVLVNFLDGTDCLKNRWTDLKLWCASDCAILHALRDWCAIFHKDDVRLGCYRCYKKVWDVVTRCDITLYHSGGLQISVLLLFPILNKLEAQKWHFKKVRVPNEYHVQQYRVCITFTQCILWNIKQFHVIITNLSPYCATKILYWLRKLVI